jgi:hypothetical protein
VEPGEREPPDPDMESWTVRHFSQTNPVGPGRDDVPALLRRIADTVQELGPVEVQDIVFHRDLDEDGEWCPLMTVYFHPQDDD